MPVVWHPWRTLREREDIIVAWTDRLPSQVLGVTDGARIWMAREQLQVERRCTLTHELIHIEQGHHGCQPAHVERLVSVEASCRLITIEDLCRVAVWARSMSEAADELWVDVDTLLVRLESLDTDERVRLDDAFTRRGYAC